MQKTFSESEMSSVKGGFKPLFMVSGLESTDGLATYVLGDCKLVVYSSKSCLSPPPVGSVSCQD